jgi:hypothetical protein
MLRGASGPHLRRPPPQPAWGGLGNAITTNVPGRRIARPAALRRPSRPMPGTNDATTTTAIPSASGCRAACPVVEDASSPARVECGCENTPSKKQKKEGGSMRPSPPPRRRQSNGFLDCQPIVVGDDDDDDDADQRRVGAPKTSRDEGGEGMALVVLVRVPSDALYRERLVAVPVSHHISFAGRPRRQGQGSRGNFWPGNNNGGAAQVRGLARKKRATAWVRVARLAHGRKRYRCVLAILANIYVASYVQARFSVTGRGTRSEFPSQRHVSSSPTPADRRLLPPASFRARRKGAGSGSPAAANRLPSFEGGEKVRRPPRPRRTDGPTFKERPAGKCRRCCGPHSLAHFGADDERTVTLHYFSRL